MFIDKRSSRLVYESLKASEIKTSMLFNLFLANNTTFWCFFLIIDLYFLIPAIITQFFNPIPELVIPTRLSKAEAKAEIEK